MGRQWKAEGCIICCHCTKLMSEIFSKFHCSGRNPQKSVRDKLTEADVLVPSPCTANELLHTVCNKNNVYPLAYKQELAKIKGASINEIIKISVFYGPCTPSSLLRHKQAHNPVTPKNDVCKSLWLADHLQVWPLSVPQTRLG